jgi:hypothetical protein
VRHAWHIRLADPAGNLVPLGIQPNPEMDRGFANQNRFQIAFDAVRDKADEQPVDAGLDFAVQAGLEFAGGMRVIATWRVRFLPLVRPSVELRALETGQSIPTVEGCDVVLTGSDGEAERPGCDRDLSVLPPAPTKVAPATPLQIVMDGWWVTDIVVNCGSQSDRVFSARSEPGCMGEPEEMPFPAPTAGDWTLAVALCAHGGPPFESSRICGTWYASIDTR